MPKKEFYSHKEVQDLINQIIWRDSMGDSFYYAARIMKECEMELINPFQKTRNDNWDLDDSDME